MSSEPAARSDGTTVALTGPATLAAMDRLLAALPEQAEHLDLSAVERVDTAGLAAIADWLARIERSQGRRPQVHGQPPGLAALCKAYRIEPDFSDFP
ncbi:MAG TPA: anti-sigma B factor antagonist [Xanthomonadales bacterium]|nr:anti-sigma B factor antagonist [Xanthomonadales bacterium]